MSISNPADYDVYTVIQFLNEREVRPVKIHWRLDEVYGEGVMNDGNVHRWWRLFKEENTNIYDEEWSGQSTIMNEGLNQNTDEEISWSRHFTIDEFH